MSSEDLVNTLQKLAEVLQKQRTLGAALASIAEAATVSDPGCDAATIAISLSGRPSTAAITARVALELDMLRYDTHDGPCLRAFRTMRTVRVELMEEVMRSPTSRSGRGARVSGVCCRCPPYGAPRRWQH